jgi:hypothetical protein
MRLAFSQLLAKTKPFDDATISLCILLLQIGEMPAPLAYQLVEAASRMIVVLMNLEVLGQLADPGR